MVSDGSQSLSLLQYDPPSQIPDGVVLDTSEDGSVFMDVTRGSVSGKLFLSKFRAGKEDKSFNKQFCILFNEDQKWYTPLLFQDSGGRSATKNWKKSIYHRGNQLLKLISWLLAGDDNTGYLAGAEADASLVQSSSASRLDVSDTMDEVIIKAIDKALKPFKLMLQKELNALRKELEKAHSQIQVMQKKLESLEVSLPESMDNRNDMRNDVRNDDLSDKIHLMQAHQKTIELSQQEQRKNNIIISGLPESEDENIIDSVKHLFGQQLNMNDLNSVSFKKVVRIGKISKAHVRLVLVSVGSFHDKLKIIKNKRKLKGSDIFLQDDRTPEQREKYKRLRNQC